MELRHIRTVCMNIPVDEAEEGSGKCESDVERSIGKEGPVVMEVGPVEEEWSVGGEREEGGSVVEEEEESVVEEVGKEEGPVEEGSVEEVELSSVGVSVEGLVGEPVGDVGGAIVITWTSGRHTRATSSL